MGFEPTLILSLKIIGKLFGYVSAQYQKLQVSHLNRCLPAGTEPLSFSTVPRSMGQRWTCGLLGAYLQSCCCGDPGSRETAISTCCRVSSRWEGGKIATYVHSVRSYSSATLSLSWNMCFCTADCTAAGSSSTRDLPACVHTISDFSISYILFS